MASEAWLAGPVPGVSALLMPVAHALAQARVDLRHACEDLTAAELIQQPGGAASVAFHLRHIAGSADRLLTYALGKPLSDTQHAALQHETNADGASAAELLSAIDVVFERVEEVLRTTPDQQLTSTRFVGRARLPSTVLGLLFHLAEHTQRHTGQVITTARIVRAGRSA